MARTGGVHSEGGSKSAGLTVHSAHRAGKMAQGVVSSSGRAIGVRMGKPRVHHNVANVAMGTTSPKALLLLHMCVGPHFLASNSQPQHQFITQ